MCSRVVIKTTKFKQFSGSKKYFQNVGKRLLIYGHVQQSPMCTENIYIYFFKMEKGHFVVKAIGK